MRMAKRYNWRTRLAAGIVAAACCVWTAAAQRAEIKANGSDGPVAVTTGETVSVEVSLTPKNYAGRLADWWCLVRTPFDPPGDWYRLVLPLGWAAGFDVSHQGPLFDLSSTLVLNQALPAGTYTFYFGADWVANGVPDGGQMAFDTVQVNVTAAVPPPDMVLIPAGAFSMGDSLGDGWNSELPVHTVNVSAVWMSRHEVTKTVWDEVAAWAAENGYDVGPSNALGQAADHPVYNVTWYDALKWCNARSEKEGRTPAYYTSSGLTTVYRTGELDLESDCVRWDAGYRLPTEAEWEKAARGGAAGQRFPWDDSPYIDHRRANYYSHWSGGVPYYPYDMATVPGYHPAYNTTGEPYTSPAGSFAPNGYGLYDMAGNIQEWCWDWHGLDYYDSSPASDPHGPEGSSYPYRVVRGGGFPVNAFGCRVAIRMSYPPGSVDSWRGFRIVLPADSR